jgi:hypothetical protein
MRFFKDTTNQVHGYDETISFFTPLIEKAIAAGWQEVTGNWPPTETQAQAQDRLSPSVTSAINDGAQAWGYDDIVSAVSYLTSTNPQYVKEAQALNQWRDQVWAWAIPALNSVQPNEAVGQFLATMPAAPTRP